mmetsp:Transcript_23960/g.49060  ORF Transcript_23960/g.49060 Transcript_23960/m.49060 type:complete len:148 (-) Transcript_23960:75-518(-)
MIDCLPDTALDIIASLTHGSDLLSTRLTSKEVLKTLANDSRFKVVCGHNAGFTQPSAKDRAKILSLKTKTTSRLIPWRLVYLCRSNRGEIAAKRRAAGREMLKEFAAKNKMAKQQQHIEALRQLAPLYGFHKKRRVGAGIHLHSIDL